MLEFTGYRRQLIPCGAYDAVQALFLGNYPAEGKLRVLDALLQVLCRYKGELHMFFSSLSLFPAFSR